MLLQLSQFLPLCAPPPSISHSLRQFAHHFMSMGHEYKFSGYSMSYTVLTFPWLFCNYLFALLNPLTPSPNPPCPPPISQWSKCSLYPWFCLYSSCLLSLIFLDPTLDWYVFIAILLFIILIYFFLISPFNISYNNNLEMMHTFKFSCLRSSLTTLQC